MSPRSFRPLALFLALGALAIVVGCGGGDDGGGGDGDGAAGNVGASDSNSGGGNSAAGGGGGASTSRGSGTMTVGTPTQNSNPGQSWVDVDGQRLTYEANGSIHYECSVTADRIAVNYQTADGKDLAMTAALQDGEWFGSLTIKPGGDGNVQYSAAIPADARALGIGDNAASYDGQFFKIVGFDLQNREALDATIAINCASPGGDPMAVIDGTEYTFPLAGAQSVTCEIAEDHIEVRINRLALENLQLAVDATGPEWVGAAVVYAGESRFRSPLPADGAGLTIDGGSLSYEGTFVDTEGVLFEGTIEVTCS